VHAGLRDGISRVFIFPCAADNIIVLRTDDDRYSRFNSNGRVVRSARHGNKKTNRRERLKFLKRRTPNFVYGFHTHTVSSAYTRNNFNVVTVMCARSRNVSEFSVKKKKNSKCALRSHVIDVFFHVRRKSQNRFESAAADTVFVGTEFLGHAERATTSFRVDFGRAATAVISAYSVRNNDRSDTNGFSRVRHDVFPFSHFR